MMMSTIIEGVSHVDTSELYKIIEHTPQQVYVIDVREPEEYNEVHIPGVPLIPMGDIPDLIESFDKSAEYVIVCRSGRRSLEVSKFFQQEGIEKVHNYYGGMLAWDREVEVGPEHIIETFSMDKLTRERYE
ncbi:rhodanese-like domain-containing protein [Paenibacillus sp. FA6]|uniref:rhodanese-like domain-containing protein n=1 Tax=Paenibacillus sp. FA6 TaxID=3413029 RepID=UPI003F657DAD